MSAPTLPERLDRIEDELAGLESMIDARTRKLWAEIQKLQAGIHKPETAQKAQGGDDGRSTSRENRRNAKTPQQGA